MKAVEFFIGFVLGIVTAVTGVLLFLELFTDSGISGINTIRQLGIFGQVITLGSILNLIVFFLMIWKKKDMVAKGIILATITLALLTIML